MATAVAVVALLINGTPLLAQTDIHRCEQADGTVSFQGTPCEELTGTAEERPESVGTDTLETSKETSNHRSDDDVFSSPFDDLDSEQVDSVTIATVEQSSRIVTEVAIDDLPGTNQAECEDATRSAIDAIDRELALIDDPEGGRRYLNELLQLTEQLRACGRLPRSADDTL